MDLNILHTGDWHVRDKDIEECRKVLHALCDRALAGKSELDLIVIAGDLTDRNDVKFDSQTARLVIWAVTRLSHAAPVAIVSGTRFHDGNIPELMQEIRSHHPVHVSTSPGQVVLTEDNRFIEPTGKAPAKAIISLIPTPTKQYFESRGDIEDTDRAIGQAMTGIFANMGMVAINTGLPHVLAGHWQVGGAYVSDTQQLIGRDIEISVDQILSARPAVACLGHIHYAQQIGKHPVFYCGSGYRKDYGEMEDKGFWIHTISGAGLQWSRWEDLPSRKLVRVQQDYTEQTAEPEDTAESLAQQYAPEEISGSHVRMEFRVWQDQREKIDRAEIRQNLLDMGAAEADVRIVAIPRKNVRAAKVLQAERLRHKITARAEIIGDCVPESVLEKCDAIEAETAEGIVEEARQAAEALDEKTSGDSKDYCRPACHAQEEQPAAEASPAIA